MPAIEALIAVRSGSLAKKCISVVKRRTGIYVATFQKRFGGVHVSYHTDGSYFFRAEKIEGPDPPVVMRTPLKHVRGLTQMLYFSMGVPRVEFDRLPQLTDRAAFNSVTELDLTELKGRLEVSVYLVEPSSGEREPILLKHRLSTAWIRGEAPWVRIDLYTEKLSAKDEKASK